MVATEAIWPTEPKIFALWLFTEKLWILNLGNEDLKAFEQRNDKIKVVTQDNYSKSHEWEIETERLIRLLKYNLNLKN